MRKLNNIRFVKTNGGMARPSASEDPISGLIFEGLGLTFGVGNIVGMDEVRMNASIAESYAKKLQYVEQLDDLGITHTDAPANGTLSNVQMAMNAVYYHVSEFFRINPEGTLYLMLKASNIAVDATDIEELQNYAGGSLRQVGVFNSTLITPANLKTALDTLDGQNMPLSVVSTYSGSGKVLTDFTDLTADGYYRQSVLIGCDFNPTLLAELGSYAYYGCIGACLGSISKALVSECIGWVSKFPLGFESPALINGNLVRNLTENQQKTLNGNRYIFVRTFVGDSDCYFNDSHTCDLESSDYAYIENVRSIDKATRGIRKQLLPYVNAPLKVDSSTGKLDSTMVAFYESTAAHAVEDMQKAGELSGGSVAIDPEQNILATSTLNIVVKLVPVGVMREIVVTIGFALSV
ncbi:MAG: DUF2586 family protein [Bacteroidales bacterium]|nr:DUF2586 family protein [Bacteroidales bacterium]